MAIKYATAVRNAKMDSVTSQTGTSAKLRIYNGTRPANPNTAITSQTLLVELTCNASAFAAAASGGVLTANAISNGTAAATGTAPGKRARVWCLRPVSQRRPNSACTVT